LEAVAQVSEVSQGQSFDISLPEQAGTSTQRVSVNPGADSSDVSFTVSESNERPEEVGENNNVVYRYQQFQWENMDDIETATITFNVENEFVENNDNISLQRYEEEGWTELETSLVDETGNEHTFEAETPGFSYFAVTGSSTEEEIEQQVEVDFEDDVSPGEEVEITVSNQDGEPITNAEIELDGEIIGQTDNQGILTFTPEEEQDYELSARVEDAISDTQTLTVEDETEETPPGLTGMFVDQTTSPIGLAVFVLLILSIVVYFKQEKIAQTLQKVKDRK